MHVFVFLFRSLPNGNCLYSSASICLFGHNNHLNELRWLTSSELYENANFHCQHPVLLECLKVHSNVYSNFNSIFSCSLSQKTFNSFFSTDIVKSVKDEAIYNLKFILALPTIIGTQINCIYPSIGQKRYRLLFNNVIKCYSSSVNHVTTPISVMFSRIGINENCAEFVPNHFLPIIQDSRKVLVKGHASYNSCPIPIKKLPKTFIEQASSLSVLKSKVNNTPHVNSQLSNPSSSKISTGPKVKPSILTIKKLSQFTYQKINNKISEDTSDSDVCHPASISDKNDECSTQIIITDPFSSTVESESFLNSDFGVFHEQFFHKFTSLTDFQKYDIILNHKNPAENFIFPADKNKRPFVRNWLTEFPWVAYSEKLNGCFCVPCALFYHEVPNCNTMTKKLYSEPLTGFSKNAHKRLADHQNKTGTIHQKTMPVYDNFMKIMKGKMLAIKDQVQLKPDQVIFNPTLSKLFIETIIFCGRQALSLRGHRDDPQFYNSSLLEFTSVNVGNFLELIPFRVAAGDGILKRHILKAPSNAKYMSKTIQNELICLCGEEIVTGIISEVKESRVFSILVDEVRDCSNTEQMSFVIQFVDKSCQIREEFL